MAKGELITFRTDLKGRLTEARQKIKHDTGNEPSEGEILTACLKAFLDFYEATGHYFPQMRILPPEGVTIEPRDARWQMNEAPAAQTARPEDKPQLKSLLRTAHDALHQGVDHPAKKSAPSR